MSMTAKKREKRREKRERSKQQGRDSRLRANGALTESQSAKVANAVQAAGTTHPMPGPL